MSPQFRKIKQRVLGPSYELSFAFVPASTMRTLNRRYKHKDKISNVLAFPYSRKSGEVLLCKAAAAPHTTTHLFIHALLHLKGYKHGATMERKEEELLARYAKSNYRNRRRHLQRQSRHSRKARS